MTIRNHQERTHRAGSGLILCLITCAPCWALASDPSTPAASTAKSPGADSVPVQTVQATAPASGTPVTAGTPATAGAPPAQPEKKVEYSEEAARSTAVALNYCRASFHRLRQNPSRRVWFEEQQHILNNLNLREISDPEVIALYTSVLDEVSKERIAEKERKVLQESYKHQVRRQVLSNAFVLGAELTTAQYVNAVRTGANSWWDYRATETSKELDIWKVEKTRLLEVNDKSNKFLNTFWDLAKKKQIPDAWLIRGNNLDELEKALAEHDPAVRLRILKRMEPVMVCYPPYYYHLARTQQAQGMWLPAIETYNKLVALGEGHFRTDDMLASGLANMSVLQSHVKSPDATKTAQRALKYATGAWQVNLVCARILQQNGQSDEAEEAILRNLDVDLERPQSLASLVSLYVQSNNETKLLATLADPGNVAELPATSLLLTAARLGPQRMPPNAYRQLITSLYVYERAAFGRSQLVCMASPAWGLDGAQALLLGDQPERPDARGISSRGNTQLSFRSDGVVQYTPTGDAEIVMEITYADGTPIKLHLRPQPWSPEMSDHVEHQPGRAVEVRELFPLLAQSRPRTSFIVAEAEMGNNKVALWDRGGTSNQQMLVDQQKKNPTASGVQPRVTTKPLQVIIEGVKPLPPLKQELVRPVTPPQDTAPATTKPEPVETAKPVLTGPTGKPLFRPAPFPAPSGVRLSDELETFDGDEELE